MEYVVLFEAVVELIKQCLENRTVEEIKSGLMKPKALEIVAFTRLLRKEGYRGRELRQKRREGFEELKSAGLVDQLVREATEQGEN